jgi:hypothetical protein
MNIFKRPKLPKPPKSIRRVKKRIGDVIEIPTAKGLAYVQYTHYHSTPPKYGCLIRVLQGFYDKRPDMDKIEFIVNQQHRFQTFCPIYKVVNIGDWDRIGNFPVPVFAQKFPIFKAMKYLFKRPKPEDADWYLWDGEKEWYVGKLSLKEQEKYPKEGIYNDTGLIHAIETGMSGEIKLC